MSNTITYTAKQNRAAPAVNEDGDILKLCIDTMTLLSGESCGKCAPCRLGCHMMLELLRKISSGAGCSEDLDKLWELGVYMQESSLCSFGRKAPAPVLAALESSIQVFQAAVGLEVNTATNKEEVQQWIP